MGHRPSDVWKYTPRRIAAFLFIAEKRRNQERIEAIHIGAMAARGDPKEVKKFLKGLERA
jgi:hypothetical protein